MQVAHEREHEPMSTGHIARLQSLPYGITDLIADSRGFCIGTTDCTFAVAEHSNDEWVYRCEQHPLEYRLRLRQLGDTFVINASLGNVGDSAVSGIDVMEPLRLVFNRPEQQWRHQYANGGFTDSHYPPGPYALNEWSCATERLRMESHHRGYSSNQHLPILMSLCSTDPGADGFFCALEWSGSWYITFEAENAQQSRVSAGIPVHNLELQPGESLELPNAHIGFFSGGPDGGTNALRRYLYEHVCPRYDGEPVLPRVSYDHWFGIANDLNDDILRRQADRAAAIGVEMFVVDAGWFPGGFPDGVGNWEQIDETRFPNGLEPIADYVRGKGMQFGLWFEPERAGLESHLYTKHPDWFVRHDYGQSSPIQGYHINMALTEVQDYFIDLIGGMIGRLGIKWTRWDYNIDPGVLWRLKDPSNKLQFAYYQGLYRVVDTLMARYPDWMVEMCAGGGRRVDLGTMRRAHTYWFSDHSERAPLCRFMQARANRFLPGHLLNSSVPVGCRGGDTEYDATTVLSRMLGKLAFDGRVADLTDEQTACMARWVRQFKAIRHLLVQDFYQLLPQPATVEDWDAVQFVSYDGDEAVLFVFAGNTAATRTLSLKGLTADSSYAVTLVPDGQTRVVSGAELMSQGVTVALEPFEGALLSATRS
ncbi:MAG: hypothetical protein GF331_18430 [Chitinivibrionales bacterium]|nr:hypothetical protein [Chitinivibrionales bacterium]